VSNRVDGPGQCVPDLSNYNDAFEFMEVVYKTLLASFFLDTV